MPEPGQDPGLAELTEEILQQWIYRFGAIFRFEHLDQLYIYRRLTRRELRSISMIEDELLRTELVADTCILFPFGFQSQAYMDMPAGILECVVDKILVDSGVGNPMNTLEYHRAYTANNIEAQMEAMIEHVFAGGGNFDKFMDMSPDQFYEAYSRAELIAAKVLNIDMRIEKPGQQKAAPAPKSRRAPMSYQEKQQASKDIKDNQKAPAQTPEQILAMQKLDEQTAPERMAEQPMSEVLRRQRMSNRRLAMRQALEKEPYKPPQR